MAKKLKFPPRAIGVRHVGLPADNAFIGSTSAARVLMVSKQRPQTIELINPDISSIQSGLEKDLHRHTMKIDMPCDAEILEVIPISPTNPWRTTVLYKDVNTGELGHLDIRQYYTGDGKYGFMYKPTEHFKGLTVQSFVEAGTPLMEAPSSFHEGELNYGVELNTCIGSFPETAEDGIKISRSAINRMAFHKIDKRTLTVEYGEEAIDTYDDGGIIKVVPEPGMTVRPDGVLMATRSINDPISILLSHTSHLGVVNHDTDEVYQVHGDEDGGGIVTDLWVLKSNIQSHTQHNPQLDMLANLCYTYQLAVLAAYRKFRYATTGLKMETEAYITDMKLIAENAKYAKESLNLTVNKTKLNPYHIEIVVSKRTIANLAAKVSDRFSAKGVIVDIEEDENMPVDQYGVRADIVVSKEAGSNRNIVGRDHAMVVTNCLQSCTSMLRHMSGIPVTGYQSVLRAVRNLASDVVEAMLNLLHEVYTLINRDQATALLKYRNDTNEMSMLLADCIHRGVVVGLPLDVVAAGNNLTSDHAVPVGAMSITEALLSSKFYRVPKPVSYVDPYGKRTMTVHPLQIAPVYYALLDKLGQDPSATYTTYRQARGLVSVTSKHRKHTYPISTSNVKVVGNDEAIVLAAQVGPVAMAKFIRNLASPKYNAIYVEKALSSGKLHPVDEESAPSVGDIPGLAMVNHVFLAAGIELYYESGDTD